MYVRSDVILFKVLKQELGFFLCTNLLINSKFLKLCKKFKISGLLQLNKEKVDLIINCFKSCLYGAK